MTICNLHAYYPFVLRAGKAATLGKQQMLLRNREHSKQNCSGKVFLSCFNKHLFTLIWRYLVSFGASQRKINCTRKTSYILNF